ncbi:hypothetical protein KCU91_g12087, partial [Aureobasidium melanogenum]
MSDAKRKRQSVAKAVPKQQAGNPENPSTFLSCNENESQTAAYLGYSAANQLRDLAASWPLLRAYVKYSTIMENLRAHDTLRLLHTSHDEFQNVEDPSSKWPIPATNGDHATVGAMKARHLGWLLVRLKADLEAMASHSAQKNQDLQSQYFDEFSKVHTNPDAPVVSPNHVNRTIKSPILGPLDTESTVEPYNRCLMALKYLQHGLRSKKFARRLADEPKKGNAVPTSFTPQWMLPKPTAAKEIPAIRATAEADKLPYVDFHVNWIPTANATDLEDELEERYSACEKPSSKQMVTTDPRLFPSIPTFRDQLRRQYSCADLHMQIHRLSLEYKTHDGNMSSNVMREEWGTIQAIMRDPANKDFVFNVGFAPMDEEEEVFETDYHPSFEGYFRQEGDNNSSTLELNDLALQERATALTQSGATQNETTPNVPSTSNSADSPQEDMIGRFLNRSSEDDIGTAPDPLVKFAGDLEAMKRYYDGIDVTQPEQLLQWQKSTLEKITTTAKFTSTSYEKPKKGVLSKEEEKKVAESRFLGAQTAESRERNDTEFDQDMSQGETTSPESVQQRKQALEDNERYYTLRAAYSGTQAQVGPPLDLCLQLLACEQQPSGLWRSKLFTEATDSDFYHYQISGAVGCILKLYGRIDVDALLSKSKKPYAFDVEKVRQAADKLHDLLIHGAVLGDDVGFGKTKQLLLIGHLHTLLSKDSEHRPTLLVVPSTLVHGWIKEIRNHWKCFRLVVSFEDHDWKTEMALNSLKASHMQNYGIMENAIPEHLTWLFDKNNSQARAGLVITSYETHKARTAERVVELVAPGEHYDPPRTKPNGKPDWLRKPRKVQLLQQWEANKELMEKLDQTHRTDPLNSDKDSIHKRVMAEMRPVLETVMIRRSASSKLQNTDGTDLPLRDLFKKTIRKTHQEAAAEFDEKMSKARKVEHKPPPGQPTPVSKPAPFALPMAPLRRLALANFSPKMARLNANMERMEGDTHVSTLQKWREDGKEADFLVDITRTQAERRPRTAAEVSTYLAKGSPTLALLSKEILAGHILDPLDPEKYKNHQKLIVAEGTPANAYWIQTYLRSLGIDARVLHAGLSNKAKAAMVDLFNDPKSSLKVLIMMYDVGAAGLNLHEACNRVFIASIARAFALEEQVGGRTNRITSIFDTRVTRRSTPNSHDLFRASVQADKVTVQLATNAQDPNIQDLIVTQLNKLQSEVDECHASEEGQELLKKISEHNTLKEAQKFEVVGEGHRYDLRKRSEKKPSTYDEQCGVCGEDVSDGNGCTCNECGEFAHSGCHGLDSPMDGGFYCRKCVEDGALGMVEDAALTEDGAYILPSEDDNDEYVDPARNNTARIRASTPHQNHAEGQLFDEPDLLLGDDNLAEWVSENQPSDLDRKRLVLLSLPANKAWSASDLENEHYLRVGLLLLFNLIQGKEDLAISRSIHIEYSQLSQRARDRIYKRLELSQSMEKRQQKLAGGV